jgi:DNA processing protein
MTQLPIDHLDPDPDPLAGTDPNAGTDSGTDIDTGGGTGSETEADAQGEKGAESQRPRPAGGRPSPQRAEELRARIALSLLSEAGDKDVALLVSESGARRAAAELARYRVPRRSGADLAAAVADQVDRARKVGARCLLPGDTGWPSQLADLGPGAPLLLWVRGGKLRESLIRSISVVGARACSPYGRVQAETLAADLALFGWTIVSGGAYGIDAAAHAGALAVGGGTVLVSAGGVDRAYPRGNEHLYGRVLASGCVVSEYPLGSTPARHRFLVRNRLIAALSRGTVVVEAGHRSGARSTAASAGALNRHVMAVPGPVTSDLSSGCHDLIRDGEAVLVRNCADVQELVTPMGEPPEGTQPRDVLAWLAVHGPAASSRVAAEVGLATPQAEALLTMLEGAGMVTRVRRGWAMAEAAMLRFAKTGS